MENRNFLSWPWTPKEVTYTASEVEELVEQIKHFNAGAIDEHLSRHVDIVFANWLSTRK